MDNGNKSLIITIIGILLLVFIIAGGIHINKKLKIENFQKTIADLNDEQKCMHICGFQYSGYNYFDQYKFCIEKCDRISERDHKCNYENERMQL